MKTRRFGKTGWMVSEISLGTWQVGGKWGSGFNDKLAEEIINTAIDLGVNFIDTADVYEGGKSEAAVARVVRRRSERVYVATKCGRFLNPHINEAYTPAALRKFVESSLKNTGLETLDLIQLHCPPREVFYRPEIFESFDRLREEGKIRHLGVSVEKVEDGLKAIEYDNVVSIQIIFNIFRQRPAESFFRRAVMLDRAVLVRVPLASGLLSGQYTQETVFDQDDHRNFNREGMAFDKGETFSGVPYQLGIETVAKLKNILPTPMAEAALRWILGFKAVSTIIPGASRVEQIKSNSRASDTGLLDTNIMAEVEKIYEQHIKLHVHHLW